MLTDEQIKELAYECGLHWEYEYDLNEKYVLESEYTLDEKYVLDFARAIEKAVLSKLRDCSQKTKNKLKK